MFGLETWIRILALVFAGIVIGALNPGAGVDRALLHASSWESMVAALAWHTEPARLFSLRAFYLFDFLFLLAHGSFFHRLLNAPRRGNTPLRRDAVWMMAADAVENIAALTLINAVFLNAPDGTLAWHRLLVAGFLAKWITVAWTYFCCLSTLPRGIRQYALALASLLACFIPVTTWLAGDSLQRFVQGSLLAALAVFLIATAFAHNSAGTSFRALFYLRVPLAATAVVSLLAAVAFGPLRNFFFAILHFYDRLSGIAGLCFTALIVYFLAYVIPLQARVVLVLGTTRLLLPATRKAEMRRIVWFLHNCLLAGVTLLMLSSVVVSYGLWTWRYALIAAGWAIAIAIVGLADITSARLTENRLSLPLLLLPGAPGRSWLRRLRRATRKPVPGWVSRLGSLTARWRLVGYLDSNGSLFVEQAGALALFLVGGGLFLALMLYVYPGRGAPPPSLASLALLVAILSGIASGITFFFDRYGIPAILVLFAIRLALNLPERMDNIFLAAAPQPVVYSTPGAVLSRYAGKDAVVIAASGGGIQAAAWMTHVIQQLSAEPDFRRRVALISGVSGGSVGAFHLGHQWAEPDWTQLQKQVHTSSLGHLSVSLLGPDLFRPLAVLFPYGRELDRGFALERNIESPYGKNSLSLDDWAPLAGNTLPAFLFNTTVVETGAPVAFSTTEIPSPAYLKYAKPLDSKHPVRSWRSLHPPAGNCLAGANVKISTAARLSATFPYVSPAARLDAGSGCPTLHFVDGGYYDNYGLVGLLQWVDDALEERKADRSSLPRSIRIVVIRGALPLDQPPATVPRNADQLTAPATAFLHMRSYAQWSGTSVAVRLLQDKWRGLMEFRTDVIDYPDMRTAAPECAEEPLTWKLTGTQQSCLARAWAVHVAKH